MFVNVALLLMFEQVLLVGQYEEHLSHSVHSVMVGGSGTAPLSSPLVHMQFHYTTYNN